MSAKPKTKANPFAALTSSEVEAPALAEARRALDATLPVHRAIDQRLGHPAGSCANDPVCVHVDCGSTLWRCQICGATWTATA